LKKYTTMAEYLADLDPMQLEVAQIMRDLLADAAPDAVETISYNMPAIKLNGKVLVYFAPTKNHLGFYPTDDPILKFEDELASFETTKGTIKLPYNQPLPVKLIREIVTYRIDEVTKTQA